MKLSLKTVAVLFSCMIVLGHTLLAGTTGKISGRVTDKKTGEGLPGANVLIEGSRMGASTDPDGYFTIINIPPATYKLTVRYVGYVAVSVENVEVNVDRTTRQDIAVPSTEGVAMDEVVIRGERPAIQKDRTQSVSIVSTKNIEEMPVTEVSEVIQLQPGVVAGSGGELHFRGGRAREVGYIIDGVPVNNAFSQGGGANVAVDNAMIQQIEVISGTFNAEYGAAQSGIVNIVTKGPESKFTGTIQAYTGEWYSNRSDVFLGIQKINPFANKDVQATLSGPIFEDKLGFFATARYSNNQSYLWYDRRYMPIDGWKISAYQRWYGEHYAALLSQGGRIYIPDFLKTGDGSEGPLNNSEALTVSAKLNYFPVPTVRLSYQLFQSGSTATGGDASRRYQPDQTATSKAWSQHHFLTFQHSPSSSFFYNLRFSYQHNVGDTYYRKDNLVARYPGDAGIQPIGSSSNGFSLGNTAGFYDGKDGKNYRDLFMVNGDVNWQVDRYNFIKAGFEVSQHAINTYSYGYESTEAWAAQQYTSLIKGDSLSWPAYWEKMVQYWDTLSIQRYRRPNADEVTQYRDYTIRPLEAAAYIQDKIELGEVIVNAGARLDLFQPNEMEVIDGRVESYMLGSLSNLKKAKVKYQVSPRFGLSFPISANGAFHVAYGHFFQMPSYEKIYNIPLNVMTSIQLNGQTLGNAGIEPERTIAYEIGVQQAVTPEVAVDVTAYYKDIRNLLGIEKVITVDGVGYNHYINRDYGNVKGITFSLRKEGRGLVSGSISYTLQYARGSSSDPEALQLIQTSTRLGGDPVQFVERRILALDWDQRHTLNGIVTLAQPGDWSVSVLGTMGTGQPYSPTFIERYDMPTREYTNSENKPLGWTVDLKAKKYFMVNGLACTVFLKVDNIFDHLNENSVYAGSGTARSNPRLPYDLLILQRSLAEEGNFTLPEVDNHPEWYSSPRRIQLGIEVGL